MYGQVVAKEAAVLEFGNIWLFWLEAYSTWYGVLGLFLCMVGSKVVVGASTLSLFPSTKTHEKKTP